MLWAAFLILVCETDETGSIKGCSDIQNFNYEFRIPNSSLIKLIDHTTQIFSESLWSFKKDEVLETGWSIQGCSDIKNANYVTVLCQTTFYQKETVFLF